MSSVPVWVSSVTTDQLVDRSVQRHPDKVAVRGPDAVLTFRELNQQADELACRLTESGAVAGRPVAVELPRGAAHVVATLAVWKAGCACVPVDPFLPPARVERLLSTSAARLVIRPGGRIAVRPETEERIFPPSTAAGDRIAYVFFTSGSTGEPKAVGTPHSGIVNEALWTGTAFHLRADDCGSWLSSPGFAISRWELWSSLAAGVSVVVADADLTRDGPTVRDWLLRNDVTWSIVVTSLGEQLFAQEWPAECGLRLLATGGEQLRTWPRGLPFDVVNSYGATETSGVRLAAKIDCQQPIESRLPPLGQPIDNTRVYVLDERMNPVAAGEVGELYIGGIGLAQGYLNSPDLTARRFVDDPFSGTGEQLYRTGDLVCQNPRGDLEFVARKEGDVKIGGIRVDSGEVEATLLTHPEIAEAVVLTRTEPGRHAGLVAYVTSTPGSTPVAHELRRFLASRLPSPMVPSRFFRVSRFPLMSSGKINRSALAEAAGSEEILDGYVAPDNEVEKQVVAEVEATLSVAQVGVYDDFFGLGGDSLDLARMKERLEQVVGLELSLADCVRERTPRGIAAIIQQQVAAVDSEPETRSEHRMSEQREPQWIERLDADEILDLLTILEREYGR